MTRQMVILLCSIFMFTQGPINGVHADDNSVSISPRSWYSDYLHLSPMKLSPDAKHLVLRFESNITVVDLHTGDQRNLTAFMSNQLGADHFYANWLPGGELRIDYKPASTWLQILVDVSDFSFETVPIDGVIRRLQNASSSCESVGERRIDGVYALHYVDCDGQSTIVLERPILGLGISPDGQRVAWTGRNRSGGINLTVFDAATGETSEVASDLDGANAATNIASDALKLVFSTVGEDVTLLGVIGKQIYYQHTRTEMTVAVIPLAAGTTQITSDTLTASFPSWHPGGRKIAVTYGEWRVADWVMDWDIASLEFSTDGHLSTEFTVEVTGHHEDYGLKWSPDGKWIAFHSHRSAEPVPAYGSEGSSDDIWLRAAEGGEEIRLTSQGVETVQPDWAPDSYRLIYATMNPSYKPYIIIFDPDNGQPYSVQELIVEGMAGVPFFSGSWSPTNPEIALEEKAEGMLRRLWLVNEDGSNPRMLAEYEMLTELAGTDFTPDGKWVIFSALIDGHHQLFKAATHGLEVLRITYGDKENLAPQVSPDGNWIAVNQYSHERIFNHFTYSVEDQ